MPSLNSGRRQDLDLLKTVLVWGMIGAHVVQLITFGPKADLTAYSDFINLITFSGFLFAFGIGIGIGLPRSGEPRRKSFWQQLRPILLLLAGVYISSLAFAYLVDREKLTGPLLYDLFTMTRLFGWSEFLASFLVLYVVMAVARPLLVKIGQTPVLLVIAVLACLATTLLVVNWELPLLAAVIGTTRFASFPVLAYLPWFFLGVWFGNHPVRWWHVLPAIAATAGFLWFTQTTGDFPQRFPPSALWVIGAAAPLLLYLALSRVAARVKIPDLLLLPGRHVLSFLVLSNAIIFATRYLYNRPVRGTPSVVLWTVAIVAALSLLWFVLERFARQRT